MFKGRVNDFRDRDTAVERCVVEVFDSPDEDKCRFVIKMICRQGEFCFSTSFTTRHQIADAGLQESSRHTN